MRTSERILGAYFAYTAVLALTLPLSPEVRGRALAVNAAIAAVYGALLARRRRLWNEVVRDYLPLPLMLVAFKQMGWFAPPRHEHRFENGWIVWDRLVLGGWGLRAGIESLGPALPALLELSYLLVYALPLASVLTVYGMGRRERTDSLLAIYLLGLFLSYAQFPFWPSEPPRLVFPSDNLPQVSTVLRELNLWLLGGYSIHTSVFPSAHVSGAVAAALALRHVAPERPAVWRGYLAYALVVAVATVYGRYHYLVDALAGVAVGVAAWWIGSRMLRIPGGERGAARRAAGGPGVSI
jgi:membrane-associated phospholipid phosphatase